MLDGASNRRRTLNVPDIRCSSVGVLGFVRLVNALDGLHDLEFDFPQTMASTWTLECCCALFAPFNAVSRKVKRFECICDLVASLMWHM